MKVGDILKKKFGEKKSKTEVGDILKKSFGGKKSKTENGKKFFFLKKVLGEKIEK